MNKRFCVTVMTSLITLFASLLFAQEDGKAVYEKSCIACHGAGVAGAPKLGDASLWKDRVAKGKDVLYESSLNGVQGYTGYMPPKGGNTNLSDEAVKAAVDYMVEQCADC